MTTLAKLSAAAAGIAVVATAALGGAPAAQAASQTKTVSFQYQIDFLSPHTAAQAAAARKTLPASGLYSYRADVSWNPRTGRVHSAPLWNNKVTMWEVDNASVVVPATATAAQILAAEKAYVHEMEQMPIGARSTPAAGKVTWAIYIIQPGAWTYTTSWKKGPSMKPQILVGSLTK